jgi:peptidoglycan/xylan/chitin deacetylase (PgdA/CDA1 family)
VSAPDLAAGASRSDGAQRPRRRRGDVLVLCYHALSPTWEAPLSITPERFARQMAFLAERGYRGATFTQALLSPPALRVVAVTFDDAFRSVSELGRPILEELGWPATVFVPTGLVGSEQPTGWPGVEHWLDRPEQSELLLMSWPQLRELAEDGWEIGSHTVSHPHLTVLEDAAALERELSASKAACEQQLERECTSLAYPYGDVDRGVREATERAGYRVAAGLPEGRLGAPLLSEWPRIGIYNGDDELRFRLKVSRAVRLARRALPSL